MRRVLVVGVLAVAALYLLLSLTSVGPGGALSTAFTGSFGNPRRISSLLDEISPLLVVGAAVFLALRAGLFNIGAEGQFLLGGSAAVLVALRVGGPAGVVLGGVAGVLAGALWAFPAGLIRAYRGGHEVVTTILLNLIAVRLVDYGLQNGWRDPEGSAASTRTLEPASRLPDVMLGRVGLPPGLVVGVLVVLALAWFLKRTVAGYELQAVGANSEAARFAGVDDRRVRVGAMAISGGLAGLAGALQVLGTSFRVSDGFSGGYGFNGLGVALLAGSSAPGVLLTAGLFGFLAKGGAALGAQGVSKGIVFVVTALAILVTATARYRKLPEVR